MRCEWRPEDLSAYLDGEIGPEQAESIRLHLSACAHCRRQVEAFRQVGTLVRTVPEVSPPADLRTRVVLLDAGTPVPSATCEQARAWLSQRADAELPHWQVPVLDQHLAGCQACRREADAMKGVIGLVHALPEVNPPQRIRAAVRNAMTRRAEARRIWRMGWTGAGFALAGAAVVVLATLHPGSKPQPANVAEVVAPLPAPAAPATQPPSAPAESRPTTAAEPPQMPARPAVRVAGVRRLAGAVARAFSPMQPERASAAPVEASAAGESLARAVTTAAAEMVGVTDPREAMKAASQRHQVVASEAALATPPEEPPASVESDFASRSDKAKQPGPGAALAEAKQALKERPFKAEPIRVERKQSVVHVEY